MTKPEIRNMKYVFIFFMLEVALLLMFFFVFMELERCITYLFSIFIADVLFFLSVYILAVSLQFFFIFWKQIFFCMATRQDQLN